MRRAINLLSHNQQQQDTTCMQGIIDTIVINDHLCSDEKKEIPCNWEKMKLFSWRHLVTDRKTTTRVLFACLVWKWEVVCVNGYYMLDQDIRRLEPINVLCNNKNSPDKHIFLLALFLTIMIACKNTEQVLLQRLLLRKLLSLHYGNWSITNTNTRSFTVMK